MLTEMKEDDSVASLVRLAAKGDRTAFKALYEQYHESVYRTAYRLLGDRMRAEDVTQEVFVNIHQKLDSFNFNSTFQTWCYRITVNACYDIMRKQKRRSKHNRGPVEAESYESRVESSRRSRPGEILKRKEVSNLIDQKLQSLNEDLKAAFVLREFEGLSYADVAKILECSEGTVASRLARARSQLADFLTKVGIDNTYLK